MSKKFILITLLVLVVSIGAPSAGAQELNASDLRGSLEDQARGDEITKVLDPTIYVENVRWDGQNDTAYMTVVSEGSQQIDVIDSVRYEREGQVQIQSYNVGDGRSTLEVSAWGRGRQVLDVRTGDTLTRVQSASDLNLLIKTYWFIPPLIALILIAYFVLRGKRKDERERGTKVWDLKREEYITVIHRSISIDTSTYRGKIKYYLVRLKERILDIYYGGTIRSSILLLLVIFGIDRLALGGLIYYTIASDPTLTRIALMTIPIGIVSSYLASWIVDLWRSDFEKYILVADEGDVESDLTEFDSVAQFLDEYDGAEDQGYRFLAMDNEVFERFEYMIDDSLTSKKYGDGDEILLARQIDLERNKILPDPNILNDSGQIRADEKKIHENHRRIRKMKQAWDMLKGSAELIEDKAMEIAHENVAEQYQKALNSEDSSVSSMIEQASDLEDEGKDSDPFDDLLDAMDPRTSKGEVVPNEEGDLDE